LATVAKECLWTEAFMASEGNEEEFIGLKGMYKLKVCGSRGPARADFRIILEKDILENSN